MVGLGYVYSSILLVGLNLFIDNCKFALKAIYFQLDSIMGQKNSKGDSKRSVAMISRKTRSDRPPVRTAEARGAATPAVTKELAETLDKLDGQPREQQNKIWEQCQKRYLPETRRFVELTTRRECEHFILMDRALAKVEELKDRPGPDHDYSKEGVFFFALPAFYDGGVKGDRMKAMVDAELKRHYELEPHHPEYELYNDGKECCEADITEMAIDRLARNAQYEDGWIRMERVSKFLPKFSLGDNEAKQKMFLSKINKYRDLVQNEFYELYPEARAWRED